MWVTFSSGNIILYYIKLKQWNSLCFLQMNSKGIFLSENTSHQDTIFSNYLKIDTCNDIWLWMKLLVLLMDNVSTLINSPCFRNMWKCIYNIQNLCFFLSQSYSQKSNRREKLKPLILNLNLIIQNPCDFLPWIFRLSLYLIWAK